MKTLKTIQKMKNIQGWEQFNEANINIEDEKCEFGVFVLNKSDKEILKYIFEKSFESIKVDRARFFYSGYKGIAFNMNNQPYLLMIDKKSESFSLQIGGDVLFIECNPEMMIKSLKRYFINKAATDFNL